MLEGITIKKRETFLDYIFGGCEIGMQIAIDFTASNGPVRQPGSLHYLDEYNNQYLNAMRAIGGVL